MNQAVPTDLYRHRPRLALLVDGDNLSVDRAATILDHLRPHGDAIIRRVYGNQSGLAGWAARTDFARRLAPSGKNAADFLLAIDAMELMLTDAAEVIALASGDTDFVPVALRLRELGRKVIGIGPDSTQSGFGLACSVFLSLAHDMPPTKPPTPAQPPATPVVQRAPTTATVTRILKAQPPGLRVDRLAALLAAEGCMGPTGRQPTLTEWLRVRHQLYTVAGSGANAQVRLATITASS